jgi:replicative DNA helicase
MSYKIDEKTFRDQSWEIEKFLISGILRYPDLYDDLDSLIINSSDFNTRIHQDSWIYFGEILHKTGKISYEILGMKLMELKLNYGMDLTPLEYLKALSLMSVNKDSVNVFASKLKTLSGRKIVVSTSLEVANEALDFKRDLTLSELVNESDSKFFNQVNLFAGGKVDQPLDLFKDLEVIIEEKGNEPKDDGIICPYEKLRKLYGDFTPGDLYFFVARAKTGKTSWLMNLAIRMAFSLDQNVKILIIDTELESYRLQYRLLSSLSGVSEYFIRTGRWRQNEDYVKRIRNVWPTVKLLVDKIDHIYVGSRGIDEIISIMRRWHRKNVDGRDNLMGCIIFDYVKLSADFGKMNQNMRPDIEVGLKVDKIKKVATELQVPILSSSQTNRTNESRSNANMRISDGSVISMSDMIAQFASNIFLLNRLTLEERQEYQGSYGVEPSHSLLNIYSRSQGPEAPGFNDIVKVIHGDKVTWVDNIFLLSFDSFKFEELGCLSDFVNKRAGYRLEYDTHFDGDTL